MDKGQETRRSGEKQETRRVTAMAESQDTQILLKDTLERRGLLRTIKAKIRSEIVKAIHEPNVASRSVISDENFLINELILEYLLLNKCPETASIFLLEFGHPDAQLDRAFLTKQLGVIEDERSRKLLSHN
ncbi:hypothetical protein O6H91_07G074200 [Diphasiastrum complanatum]|uniref:Uncharacterized protein n=1 Tax=Diphasiastrum complanatum TaxID=34168 RepID=A0ACC2D737_DIPCM|nr:hypothetical protein O6H91_07G074200 [Diphasiastrum complanatum]